MAAVPPAFAAVPPAFAHLWYYLPAGTVLPGPYVPYSNQQIGMIAKAYHTHERNRDIVKTGVTDAPGMFAKFRGDNKLEYYPVRRATAHKLIQPVPWNVRPGLRLLENVMLIFQCWQTCNMFKLDPDILQLHPVLIWKKLCKYNPNTIMQLRQMLPVMIFTVMVGPQRRFVKHRQGFNEGFYILKNCTYIDDSVKYGLILPIIKTIAMVGDEPTHWLRTVIGIF